MRYLSLTPLQLCDGDQIQDGDGTWLTVDGVVETAGEDVLVYVHEADFPTELPKHTQLNARRA